ncbi:hypothetical protein X975_00364, partial [Stegodyphus mimosarum]
MYISLDCQTEELRSLYSRNETYQADRCTKYKYYSISIVYNNEHIP